MLRRLKVVVVILYVSDQIRFVVVVEGDEKSDSNCGRIFAECVQCEGGEWEGPVLQGNACFILDEEQRCLKGRKF